MNGKNRGLQFVMGTVGALSLGAVLAAGSDYLQGDPSKGKTQAQKVDKQAPATTRADWSKKGLNAPSATAKGADGSVKQ